MKGEIYVKAIFYFKTERLRDMDNMIIVIKFLLDALKSNGIILDDNYKYIRSIELLYGGKTDKGVESYCDVILTET
jgi:Holliday junction resolvase RusA-like endonuclease